MIKSEEWEYSLTEYRRVFTSIIEYCTETITIIRKKKQPRTYEDAVTLFEAYNQLVGEMGAWSSKREDAKSLYFELLTLASKSRGEFTVPNELDFARIEELWAEMETALSAHGEYVQSEMELLERLRKIAQKQRDVCDAVGKHLGEAEKWLVKLASDDLSDIPLDLNPVDACLEQLDISEDLLSNCFEAVNELRDAKYWEADEVYEMVFALHERYVQDRAEFDRLKKLGLLDPLSIKERRKLRPPLHESTEWNELIAAEEFLKDSQRRLDEIESGDDFSRAEEQERAISELAVKFDSFYTAKCITLDAHYNVFDEGTRDYQMYHERYQKFKVEAELHRGDMNRRRGEQNKLLAYIGQCDEANEKLRVLISRITSDDWGDADRDLKQAAQEHAQMQAELDALNSPIETVLAQGPLVQREVSRGRDLIKTKSEQLQADKQLAATLLESITIQMKLLGQHQSYFESIDETRTKLDVMSTETNQVMVNLSNSNAAQRADQLRQIKVTFVALNNKIVELEGQAKTVVNIRARRHRTEKHFAARAVARVKTAQLTVSRNEQLTLVSTPNPAEWACFTETGNNVTLPAVVVSLPPPNADADEVAKQLRIRLDAIDEERTRAAANCAYYQAAGRFGETKQVVLEWDHLPSIQQRAQAVTKLESAHQEAGKHVAPSSNPVVDQDYAQMGCDLEACHAHVDSLVKNDQADREAEEERQRKLKAQQDANRQVSGLREYYNELDAKAKEARDQILSRVALAIQFETPQAAAGDAQKSLNQLESIRAGATRLQGDLATLLLLKPTPDDSFELNQDLRGLAERIDFLQGLSQLYIRKVQKVQVVIGLVQATENIIARLEDKIKQQLSEKATKSDELEIKLRILKNTTFELEAQDSLVDSLTDSAKEAKALGQSVEDKSEKTDPDKYIYDVMVGQLKDRIATLKEHLKTEKDSLEKEIPRIRNQENASDNASRTCQDSERLLKELDHIKQSALKELRREHGAEFDIKTAEQRCADYTKRLDTIDSACDECRRNLLDQAEDSSLTDAGLKQRLVSAASELDGAHKEARDLVNSITTKMGLLNEANGALGETEAILARYREALEPASSMLTSVDDYEHRQAQLTDLINEIPKNDPRFDSLRHLLTPFVDHDSDRTRLQSDITRQQSEWGDVKWRIQLAQEANKKELDKRQADDERRAASAELRLDIDDFVDALNEISTAQIEVLSKCHAPFGLVDIMAEREKQQDILNRFNTKLEPRYKELMKRTKKLGLTVEETRLSGSFERVWFLTKSTIDKLNSVKNFAEKVEHVEPIIARWLIEAERYERESAHTTDVDFLNNLSREAQRAYQATADDDHSIFELPQYAAKICAAHVAVVRDATDQDGPAANEKCDELAKTWQQIKSRIQVAGKDAAANAKQAAAREQAGEASEKSTASSALQQRLKQLSERVQKRVTSETPLDVSVLANFNVENERITSEVRALKVEVDRFSTTTMDFLRKSRDLSQEQTQVLRSNVETMGDLINQTDGLWGLYLDKMARFRACCDKFDLAQRGLVECERDLARVDVACDSERERDERLQALREIQGRFPQVEPLFFALESSHQECRSVDGRLKQKGINEVGSEKLSRNIADLMSRWKQCKGEIARRQVDIKDIYDRCGKFKKSVDKHVSFLDKSEADFNNINKRQAETSEALERKIKEIESIKTELDSRESDFEQVFFDFFCRLSSR